MLAAATGTTTIWGDLDDDHIAQAVSRATVEMLDDMAERGSTLNIRQDRPGRPTEWVCIHASAVAAVTASPYDEVSSMDDEGNKQPTVPTASNGSSPFYSTDDEWDWVKRQT
jgi:hypothetical protein